MELFEYTASQLSGMLREKKVSAAEVTQSVLDRIEAVIQHNESDISTWLPL